jgi:hypothetical protein
LTKEHNIIIRYPARIFGIPTGTFLLILLLSITFFVIGSRYDLLSFKVRKEYKPKFVDLYNLESPLKPTGKTIFVSVASFRDINCMNTVKSLFKNAKHPENVFVGIVQQNLDRDPDCLTVPKLDDEDNLQSLEVMMRYKNNIRIYRMNAVDALGPVYARFLVMDKLYRNEDFIFQVDSHTRFIRDWDAKLIRDMSLLPPKSAITHYPLEWNVTVDRLPENYLIHMPIMCNGFYNHDGILQPGGAIFHLNSLKYKPVEGAFLAAGMSIYTREANEEVPLDPNLKHLFHGEELLFSVRMAAKGYRFFTPVENLCFHFYYRKNFPKFWENPPPSYGQNLKRSLQRVKYILQLISREEVEEPEETLKDLDKYGIDWDNPIIKGNVEHYYNKFGINMHNKTIRNMCTEKDLMPAY